MLHISLDSPGQSEHFEYTHLGEKRKFTLRRMLSCAFGANCGRDLLNILAILRDVCGGGGVDVKGCSWAPPVAKAMVQTQALCQTRIPCLDIAALMHDPKAPFLAFGPRR